MLDTLRANSRSVLTYVLFGIIILVFVVSFGPGSKGCGAGGASATWAAKVNGETVGLAALEQQYGQLLRFYQQQGLRDLDAPIQARLRQLAMDQVVQRELIGQDARRQGIVVTDDDVSTAIKSLPGFQSDGRFDLEHLQARRHREPTARRSASRTRCAATSTTRRCWRWCARRRASPRTR